MVNRSAAVGFGRAADLYERARPSYPAVADLPERFPFPHVTTMFTCTRS